MGGNTTNRHDGTELASGLRAPIPLHLESIKSLARPIEPAFLRRLARAGGIASFVETGTFYGQTTQAAAEIFPEVHTIELSTELHALAVQRFSADARVHAHQGESADVLARILPGMTQPVLFWLDAHYSEANTACGRENTPIVAELEAIRAAGIRDALILIDDLRCFQPERADTRPSLRGYPTVDHIRERVRRIDPQAGFTVLGDLAIAAIGSVRIAPSALLQACTVSRCHTGDGDLSAVLAAEQAIGTCAGPERAALIALAEEYQASERFGLGGHYRLWCGLAYLHEGRCAEACEDFARALELGCDHPRVRAYLAQAQAAPAVSVTAMHTTGEQLAIERCIQPGAVVFDVGANVGDWTRAALARSSDIEVHLFEASPLTFRQLRARLAPPPNARCVFNQTALSNQRGYQTFHHYVDAPAWSTFYRRVEAERLYGKNAPVEMQVPMETLDGYAALHALTHIDYLKIDVEGAEYDVLSGAAGLLSKGAIDYIQFEYGGTYSDAGITLRLVYTLLRRHGYAVFRIERDGFSPIEHFAEALEDYTYSNFLAVNERLVTLFTGAKPRMLDLPALFDRHGIRPRGVIHIGAHEGREAQSYAAMGLDAMLFVEANPSVFRTLQDNLRGYPQARAFNVAISDRDGTATLHVTSMDQSSSILPLGRHSEIYPSIVETAAIEVPARTLDSLLAEQGIDACGYNILNLDIQGAELLALRGAERTLTHIDAINTEINYTELYRGGAQIDALDAYLDLQGFTRVATTTPFHPTWGDALYIRKPVLSMSTLGSNGRFANQIFQYAFLKIQAREYGCRAGAPAWIGNTLFGTQDDPPSAAAHLPELRQTLDQNLLTCAIANAEQPLRNVDLWGYFQYHTRYYAPYKAYFRSLFRPVDNLRRELDAGIARLRAGGRTLVGLHLRRGDYGYRIFYLTPSEWYLRWLAEIWPTLENPLLYIASDEPDAVLADFAAYHPVTARDLDVTVPDAPFYPDFYVLSQCDHVAISNSSFSFAACMLNEQGRSFMRPDLKLGRLVAFDPWNSEPLQRDALAEDYGPPYQADGKYIAPQTVDSDDAASRPVPAWPPRVSVYITSYNQKAWLQEAIDSVLAQTVAPHEIIIVDDASSDGSWELLEQYRARHPHLIRPIRHDRNLGIARTRIDALTAVTGDYVTYVDGDDRFLPDKLEHELATLAANPDAELVYSNFHFIDAEGERTALWAEDTDTVYAGWIFPHVFARNFPKRTLFRNELVSCAALRRAGLHDPQLSLFEDFELRLRLSFCAQAAYCDRPLAEYRRHSGSLSHRDLRSHLAALDYCFAKNVGLLSVLDPDIRAQVQQAYQDWVTQTFLEPVEHEIAADTNACLDTAQGENLIFLLSLPWSGATLLQQIMSRHTEINAISAADILLPAIHILNAPHTDPHMAGLRGFLDTLPEGEHTYMTCVRQFAGELYRQALTQGGKRICFERAARCTEYVADIRRLFPKARFVVLLRHPGAVLETMLNNRSPAAADARTDDLSLDELKTLPARLLREIKSLGTAAVIVRYEDLVVQPETTLRRLCARLGLAPNRTMLDTVAQFTRLGADGERHDAWIERLIGGGFGRQACEYLEDLGADTVDELGYAYAATLERLAAGPAPAPAAVDTRQLAKSAIEDGEQRFAAGDLDGAERLFHAALELDSGNSDALNNLGVLNWERGDTATALECLARGLAFAPGDRSLVTNTATILHALQNNAEAVALCHGYLQKHPEDMELRSLLDTIQTDLCTQNDHRLAR